MKYILPVCMFFLLSVAPSLRASKVQDQTRYYQQGTILSVEDHEVHSPQYSGGSNPSDEPLSNAVYVYDITVRVDCGTYLAHYESPIDYLPSAFAAHQPIAVHVTKHFVYFRLPVAGEMKMAIRHRKIAQVASCETTEARP
jgi:hypothetical protein